MGQRGVESHAALDEHVVAKLLLLEMFGHGWLLQQVAERAALHVVEQAVHVELRGLVVVTLRLESRRGGGREGQEQEEP